MCLVVLTNYCQLIIVTSPIFGLTHDHWGIAYSLSRVCSLSWLLQRRRLKKLASLERHLSEFAEESAAECPRTTDGCKSIRSESLIGCDGHHIFELRMDADPLE